MAYENIRLELEGALAVLIVDRPKALNALNRQTLQEMVEALRAVAENPQLRALIVTGSGEKAFVAGADISEMAQFSPQQAGEFSGLGQHALRQLESLSVPTLAAVNGYALGGGCELAMACDLIYASERAKFGFPEVGLGVIPGFGGTQRLARIVGPLRAKELIFSGEPIDAPKAREIGLALEVLPPDKLLPHCRWVAARIARNAPLAIAQAKRVVQEGADRDLRTGLELERHAFSTLFGSEDQSEGMQAFRSKRAPNFRGV
jgi:enoyl-CoA hydratase